MPGFDILNPSIQLKRNYFIEASAGTGKTFTIENAVVRLIQEGIPIDQILVVTFTRAATLELKTRIRRNLEEKKLQKELIAFDEAKIFTIHSFCFHTLREHALETGFSLSQVEENASPDVLKRIFKDFLRTELTPEEIHPSQLDKVMRMHQNDLEKLLKELSNPCHPSGRSFSEVLQEVVGEATTLSLRSTTLFEELMQLAPCFGKMCDRRKQIKPEIEEGLARFTRIFDQGTEDLIDLPVLKMVPDNLLKNKGPYPELLQLLNQKLIPLLAELSDAELILNRLNKRFQRFLAHVCLKEDLFFYDDLLKTMEKCVQSAPFAEKVRAQYRAVLVDEFQDTDRVQWNIFSKLFLGHLPLYLVGDPKQSIYRFRGADLYTYMEAKDQMGEDAYVTLTRNFRSVPSLISALNVLFSRAPEMIALPKTGQTLFIPAIEAALPQSNEGKIVFCQTPDESALFSFIVAEIQRLHQTEGTPYGACAVLVKDHNQAKRFCSQCTLPFSTKKSESLLESEAFVVLEDLLVATYNPRERHAIAKVLGGPLFGISPEELCQRGFEDKIALFYTYHHLLESEGILCFFKSIVKVARFPSESFYLELLQLVELIAENTRGFEEYLPFLHKLKQENPESERLKVRAKCDRDAIQVMTIHVSKGLEFDMVFPIGVMAPCDIKDGEELSEKMRQLYVALTRAKKRLYLPLTEKENTPIHLFLSQVLKGESLDFFIQKNPHFSLIQCEEKRVKHLPEKAMQPPIPVDKAHPLSFPPSAIYSYSSLSEKKEFDSIIQVSEGEIPIGLETGTLLHRIFEKLDFQKKGGDLQDFLSAQLQGTHLENWRQNIETLVYNALHFPFQGPSGTFCLMDLDPRKIKRELEFLYPSDQPAGFIKGFIDLFFEYQGHYYMIDWKSNFLENYTQEKLQEAMLLYNYDLQAELYQSAARKYLHLFDAEKKLEGIFYVFLRGLDEKQKRGVYRYARE